MCFSVKQPKLPEPPKVPDPAEAANRAAALIEERQRRRPGRDATIITGGLGDPNFGLSSQAPSLRPATVLGRIAA